MPIAIFLDANILVAILNKEYPTYSYAARILSLADTTQYQIFTSPLCLAISFYFSSKKSGEKMALEKIKLLATKVYLTDCTKKEVTQTIANKSITDFEDGLAYYSAINKKCNYIVTEDLNDFYFSAIPVYNSMQFFDEVLRK